MMTRSDMNHPATPDSVRAPRLLFVEDDPAMIRILGEMLAEFPDQRFATSGEAALALAQESIPDLILLDANLPNMTGFDVCEILKRDAKLARVPVIFVTSHDAPALEVDAFRMGAADYVIKPLDAARLQARVRAQLRLRRRVLEAQAQLRVGERPSLTEKKPGTLIFGILANDSAEAHHDALEAIGVLDIVPDCENALDLARRHIPSVIVFDARCSDNEGTAQADTIGKTLDVLHAALPDVPVVVLADACDAQTEKRVLDLGAADVIAKPAKPVVLQARVRNVLASFRSVDEEIRALVESASAARVHPFPGVSRDA